MANILIVEDEEQICRMLVEEARELGHEVVAATNGEEAWAKVCDAMPDVICSDIRMPKMNGRQLKQKIDNEYGDRAPIFIFISAEISEKEVADGLMLGANVYIRKPIDFDFFARALRSATE